MPETLVDLFAEDEGHARFLDALIRRVAGEEGVTVRVVPRSVRGGHGRALQELALFLRAPSSRGSVLVVAIDANCKGFSAARTEIEKVVTAGTYPATVVACPDPHVERWYVADPESLAAGPLEVKVRPEKRKCERDRYKAILTKALHDAGHPVRLGGAEFASEIVEGMDLFRAGRREPSLKHFVEHLRSSLRVQRPRETCLLDPDRGTSPVEGRLSFSSGPAAPRRASGRAR